MKAALLLSLAILAGGTMQSDTTCPTIERLAQRNAAADARAALAKGDHHLLMLGGYEGEVPGVSPPYAYPTRMIEGTSDTTTEACSQRRAVAKAYAAKYNEIIVKAR